MDDLRGTQEDFVEGYRRTVFKLHAPRFPG